MPKISFADRIYGWVFRRWRSRRERLFRSTFNLLPSTKVLDVGGYWWTWRNLMDIQISVTCVNLYPKVAPPEKMGIIEVSQVIGDARALPFQDSSFQIGYSNSVIE